MIEHSEGLKDAVKTQVWKAFASGAQFAGQGDLSLEWASEKKESILKSILALFPNGDSSNGNSLKEEKGHRVSNYELRYRQDARQFHGTRLMELVDDLLDARNEIVTLRSRLNDGDRVNRNGAVTGIEQITPIPE